MSFLILVIAYTTGMNHPKICHTGYADCLLANSQHNLYDISLGGSSPWCMQSQV